MDTYPLYTLDLPLAVLDTCFLMDGAALHSLRQLLPLVVHHELTVPPGTDACYLLSE